MKKKLILASGSPRRREILEMAGYDFIQISPDAEEAESGMSPIDIVKENALRKAAAAREMCDGVIICADTVVVSGGSILGKPSDAAQAAEMLEGLSGNTHKVLTGWCVSEGEKCVSGVSAADVTMRTLLTDEINAYIATGSPLDKAGAYGVQDAGGMFVSGIEGDFYTVMGLPLCRISEVLREEFGILPFEKKTV